MTKIGITGQSGFLGYHLYQNLALKEDVTLVPFKKAYFEAPELLQKFVSSCDVIVHLAGVNRHHDPETLVEMNIGLAQKLIDACKATKSHSHIVYSSTTQENKDNPYGRSKKAAEKLFVQWAKEHQCRFTSLVIPNIFGPFGKPQYNSFIATFCHKLIHGETPEIIQDAAIDLIYVQDLVEEIMKYTTLSTPKVEKVAISPRYNRKVSEVLTLLKTFNSQYLEHFEVPSLENDFEKKLFLTYRTFIPNDHYPIKFTQHTDPRGSFTEIVRANTSGQFSFSTTHPDITRGNHFHTRKFERFAVIKGEALIQLRKIGTEEVINYELNGQEPAFVDMPVWYTHNIKNIGNTELLTLFWINEPYNPNDPDTYYEDV